MDHELLDQKGDFFADHDDTFSSIKHEFSRIFHENNLHSFANASDIGFLDIGKFSSRGYGGDYDDVHGLGEMDNIIGRSFTAKEEPNTYVNVGMHNIYSPMRFLQPSNSTAVNYNYTNMASNISQKQTPMQEQNYLQPYAPYKYSGDFTYMDYTPPNPNMYSQNVYDIYNQSDMMDTHPNNPLSMMWSNEISKNMGKMSDDYTQSSSYNTSQNKRVTSMTAIDNQKKTPFKIEQDFDKVSNKSLGLQMDRVAKAAPDSIASAGPRRTNRITKPLFNKNAVEDEDDDSGSDDDKEDGFGDLKNRSSRGLRVLSLKVRDIVSKKKKTSYKEVAEALLQDLSQKLKGKSQAEISKEEQNVKRRVYDALNVLIAAEILRKEGKLVCCDPNAVNAGSQGKKKNKHDKESIIEQIQEIKRRKKEKVEALQELIFKSLAIKNLVRRNQEKAEKEALEEKKSDMAGQKPNKTSLSSVSKNGQFVSATRIDVIQENPAFKQKSQDVINFPFIVLLSSSPENSMNLNMDSSQKQLSIESKKPFNIFGDIDVLLKMRLHYVSREIFEKEVPKNLQKFVSHSFTDALK